MPSTTNRERIAMHENPIAVRSKSRLADALGTLLQKKRFDSITITELCAEAKLSRPAFYQNFNSLGDVAARYLKIALDKAMGELPSARVSGARSYARACLDIYESAHDQVALLLTNGLADIVVAQCTDAFLEISRRTDYRYIFAASGVASVIVRDGDYLDRDELADVLERLIG
ncbi:MAG: hypothetical protein ACOYIP_04745 [Coriobacteriales bacterium]